MRTNNAGQSGSCQSTFFASLLLLLIINPSSAMTVTKTAITTMKINWSPRNFSKLDEVEVAVDVEVAVEVEVGAETEAGVET